MTVPAVETDALGRRFGRTVAVDGVTLRVPAGATFGYLGLNGAGKSTTVKMLTTLLAPSSGTARVAGHDVVADPLAVRRSIAYVGDEGGDAKPSWTGREYVRHFAILRGLASEEAERALDAVGLASEWRRRPMRTYSTGMKRRTELARALLGDPAVLFLDEPTRGMDLPAKRETWDLLARLNRDLGTTLFLSSHDVSEIQALCRDVAVIAGGRLTYQGPLDALGRDLKVLEERLIPLLQGKEKPGGMAPTRTA